MSVNQGVFSAWPHKVHEVVSSEVPEVTHWNTGNSEISELKMRWCGIWFCLEFVGQCRQKRVCCCKMKICGKGWFEAHEMGEPWLTLGFELSSALTVGMQVLRVERRKSREVEFPSELISTFEASRWEMVRAENAEAGLLKFELSQRARKFNLQKLGSMNTFATMCWSGFVVSRGVVTPVWQFSEFRQFLARVKFHYKNQDPIFARYDGRKSEKLILASPFRPTARLEERFQTMNQWSIFMTWRSCHCDPQRALPSSTFGAASRHGRRHRLLLGHRQRQLYSDQSWSWRTSGGAAPVGSAKFQKVVVLSILIIQWTNIYKLTDGSWQCLKMCGCMSILGRAWSD